MPEQLLVALDGSERGMTVLTAACGFARGVGASLRIITVEYGPDSEPPDLGSRLPASRSSQLRGRVGAVLGRELEAVAGARTAVEIRRGAIVPQILAEVEASHPDILVFGYHRGGPPGVIEAGSTARHLAHTAPCAVLTIPLQELGSPPREIDMRRNSKRHPRFLGVALSLFTPVCELVREQSV